MDTELFKKMFSRYCNSEIRAGHCKCGDCEWCCVNQAWDKIFNVDEHEEEDEN